MKVTIASGLAKGAIMAPPSKSMAHRMLICAGLAEGQSIVKNIALSEDVKATLGIIRALGGEYTIENQTIVMNGVGKKVVLDYSSPNVAKPFHIGHLGTTVIGHSLKLLHEFAGYECVGINYLGDWGTQFGKLIVAYNLWGDKATVEAGGVDELVKLYVRINNEIKREEEESLANNPDGPKHPREANA